MKAIYGLIRAYFICFLFGQAFANPYPDPDLVPSEPTGIRSLPGSEGRSVDLKSLQKESLRVSIAWNQEDGSYSWKSAIYEMSGTGSLNRKAKNFDWRGSFRGVLTAEDGTKYYSSIGTGYTFRSLVRDLSFRFPGVDGLLSFDLYAEDSESGEIKHALSHSFESSTIPKLAPIEVESRMLEESSSDDFLLVTIYADGYKAFERGRFFRDAAKIPGIFDRYQFPARSKLSFLAVFAPSNDRLGTAAHKGSDIKPHDSFLGLYYPYWRNFGRWYHVVYPTDELKYRRSLASAPYDYPIALIKSSEYWGVGNYNELTAIPSDNSKFGYLLMHELGHYLGLNEEYEGGGKTELEFAPGIAEPWSQNITFATSRENLKWKKFVLTQTPVPTLAYRWKNASKGPWGLYKGGYADSDKKRSHKPGMQCVMSTGDRFCPVCSAAIEAKITYDLGGFELSK